MKILAIRGRNLASLSAEFCLDFCAEPLASAGLFGITGPTGSGKSTLLDALCLALYERTPRLSRAGARGSEIPDVAGSSVAPADPRTLLRRGAPDGHAEVDFVGNDGISYRARWSVRRARGKSAGALQKSEVSLTRLGDGQVLGDHRKTETYRQIEALIGLNFEQFTRAVLLAQNDFAAFLKATDDERAELLQTLTGTGTFADISRQAFARDKEEKAKLAALEQQLADQAPLTPEERAARVADLAREDQAQKAAEEQKARLEGQVRWFETWQQRQGEEEAARVRLGEGEAAWQQAEERRSRLVRIESLQAARPLREARLRLEQEAEKDQATLNETEAGAARAAVAATEKLEQLAGAGRVAEAAEGARTAAQPEIHRAKELDAQIKALTPGFEAAARARDGAAKALAAEESRQRTLQREEVEVVKARREAEDWLAAHASLKNLAQGWPRWDLLLGQASGHLAEQGRIAAELAVLAAQEGTLQDKGEKAAAAHQLCASAHGAAKEALTRAAGSWAQFDGEAMAGQRASLETRREVLTQGEGLWHTLSEQGEREEALAEEEKQIRETQAALGAELARLAQTQPLAERAREGAERALHLAQLAASENVALLRAGLEPDSPCPVCGATDHPYGSAHPVVAGMISALRGELERCRGVAADLAEQAARARGRQQETEKQEVRNRKEGAELALALAASHRLWLACPLQQEWTALAEGERPGWFAERRSGLTAALEELGRREAAQRLASRQRDEAQGALTQAISALETARGDMERLGRELASTRQARQALEARLGAVAQQLAAALSDLEGAFSDVSWRAAWQAAPGAFAQGCREQVAAWNQHEQLLARWVQRASQLEMEIKAGQTACDTAARHQGQMIEELRLREEELAGLRGARQALFQGRPVAEVEAALAEALARAGADLERCRGASQAAEAERARLEEALRLARGRREQTLSALACARQDMARWLEAYVGSGQPPATEDDLAELLAFTPDWLPAERQALQALAGAMDSARAVLADNARRRTEHEATRPTEEALPAIRERLERLIAEMEPAKERLAGLRLELARDEERRLKSATLLDDKARQGEAARVWSQLNDLIGSADGKKFRNFAQQLTLDILLSYGNRHLATLSRRYRLERIQDSLGLLVVDQDMGDEVRSVHSLSGGESFLVSLALALGLASLSSHRVKVESLFIDEGFGSLDADSLGIAMEALDRLQSQGRKVGVISHVQEMNERLGTRIRVSRLVGGKSAVTVEG